MYKNGPRRLLARIKAAAAHVVRTSCANAGFDATKLNLTLPYEPLGARPFIPLTNPFILPSDAGTCNLGLPNLPRVSEALCRCSAQGIHGCCGGAAAFSEHPCNQKLSKPAFHHDFRL